MSAGTVQRVVVRMLFDPALVEAVYRDADAALADEGLSPAERRWLTAPDRRAYGADALLRGRTLYALTGEYPAACAVAAKQAGSAALEAFFSTPLLHGCIRAGDSLALAFGAWLASGAASDDPRVRALAPVELAMARLRRRSETARPPADGRLRLAPDAWLGDAPEGTADLYAAVRASLAAAGPDLATAALAATRPLGDLPGLGQDPETLLLIASGAGMDAQVSVEVLPEALARLLAAARPGASREALLALTRSLGVEPGEDAEIVDGLVADGLLV